jgi:hypothetical protein
MTSIAPIERIKLFNQKATKIKNSPFYEQIKLTEQFITIKFTQGQQTIDHNLSDENSLEAFLLTFRMFVQNNDPISFQNMLSCYSEIDFSQESKERFTALRDKFTALRDNLNNYLDSMCEFYLCETSDGLTGFGFGSFSNQDDEATERFTKRQFMENYIYGEYAHSNEDKRIKIQQIKSNLQSESMGQLCLQSIFKNIIGFIDEAAKINEEVLNILK